MSATAMKPDDWDFTPEHDGSLPLETIVFQALGAASACWENLAGAGIFESDRAKQIGDRMIEVLREWAAEGGESQQ